jgi:hypothetical protein
MFPKINHPNEDIPPPPLRPDPLGPLRRNRLAIIVAKMISTMSGTIHGSWNLTPVVLSFPAGGGVTPFSEVSVTPLSAAITAATRCVINNTAPS